MTSRATYLTPPQLAEIYGVKPAKILAWISSGELAALNLAARGTSRPRYRISPEAIAQFEQAAIRGAASQADPAPQAGIGQGFCLNRDHFGSSSQRERPLVPQSRTES